MTDLVVIVRLHLPISTLSVHVSQRCDCAYTSCVVYGSYTPSLVHYSYDKLYCECENSMCMELSYELKYCLCATRA